MDALEEREGWHSQTLDDLKHRAAIEAVTRWIRQATLAETPLISVITPTKDRPLHLERAIRSVAAQRYENWELVVVDDGDTEDSRPVIESVGDPRIVWSRNPGHGESAARNHALALAGGDLIAYLDDDNMMDRDWLYAVAWAFEQRSDIDVLYGAHVVDDYRRFKGQESGGLPWIFFAPWSRELLRKVNIADQSAIAHRAGLTAARYDDTLEAATDWDLMLRLTADKDPLALPAIACYYTTDAPDRICAGPEYEMRYAAVAARARAY
jgi:glycosyltransferase involved in cell wall biosynthesis